jgi:S-adenosylmethionine-diacylglycerol 3-amino-3-carboxypropyl transferase
VGANTATAIRYGQCWEDADVLLAALDIQPGDVCLSVASAGDNTLAMLSRDPAQVVAIDLNAAQIACLELRVAAYRELSHGEMLMLIGSVTECGGGNEHPHNRSGMRTSPGECRLTLYRRCRPLLSNEARDFWDDQGEAVARGIGGAGKFERYLSLFRQRILPLIHTRSRVMGLLECGTAEAREAYYSGTWDTVRWRLLFRLFFSRRVMQRIGREASFFRYVRGSVADRLLERTRYAMTAIDPADNPYLQWILFGHHGRALPYSLRAENFAAIRANLDRLTWHHGTVEDYLEATPKGGIDRFNLSDIFEYMSLKDYHLLLERVSWAGRPGARVAYWNMLVERRRPGSLADRLRPLDDLAVRLHAADKAWFYSAFVLEEIL